MILELSNRLSWFANKKRYVIIDKGKTYSYKILFERINYFKILIKKNSIQSGKIVIIYSDINLDSISLFVALAQNKNIIVPITHTNISDAKIISISTADYSIDLNNNIIQFQDYDQKKKTKLLQNFLLEKKSGLIFFSSGSTGKPKAVLHNIEKLFLKYKSSKKSYSTLAFFLFDHIAGMDTLFYTLFSGGTLIIPEKRDPYTILKTIEKYKVEVLPTSPSFINLILLTQNLSNFDLGSLKIITFGSEKMPESTLKKLRESINTNIRLIQKYGITEAGSPISKSNPKNPLWIKFNRENCDYKVINNRLYIKSKMSMIGYLNVKNIEGNDGWFNTGDIVEVDGEWIKILGRETDIINVGGQKVYPAEVESVLLGMDNINDVSVFAKDNPIMGKIVAAKINLENDEAVNFLKKRIRKYCKSRLESFKIPAYIEITKEKQVSDRFKKVRK